MEEICWWHIHDFILTKLNSYHPNIQFTFELEKNKQITFLDVVVKRTVTNQIEKCVHRKEKQKIFNIDGIDVDEILVSKKVSCEKNNLFKSLLDIMITILLDHYL